MKQTNFILIFWFSMLTCLTIFGQTSDSIKPFTTAEKANTLMTTHNTADFDQSDDFSPGMLFFALIGLALILICVGAGIVLTVLGLLAIFGLVSFGVLSTSLIVGLNKKSFAKGFKTFIVLSSTVGGLLICGTGFWLFNKIVHWWTTQTAIFTGATCGLLAGLIFGLLANYILQRLTNYFKTKLNLA